MLLTLSEVARYLSLTHWQVYRLVRSGALPARKVGRGGLWRVDRDDLERFLADLHKETAKWLRSHPLVEAIPGIREVGPRPLPVKEKTMTIREAAETIGVTRQNVHYLVKVGRLRARKADGRWLVSAEDVRAHVMVNASRTRGGAGGRRRR